jgi:hypothetical protein
MAERFGAAVVDRGADKGDERHQHDGEDDRNIAIGCARKAAQEAGQCRRLVRRDTHPYLFDAAIWGCGTQMLGESVLTKVGRSRGKSAFGRRIGVYPQQALNRP